MAQNEDLYQFSSTKTHVLRLLCGPYLMLVLTAHRFPL
ncbi:hypothetical protein OIU84_026041 [Salix udensis]|uniref:Uncharacterized protein n=1 Tax=Salix udensis TaxID=889485 RepID=A0AAD6KL04_9ROSI|nr:hypothetical protein OIU84_026041 [Salix udensis]